jgi:DNA-binding CsgD family transcriptional regulator
MILTEREYQIAGCIASDMSEKMIAAKLFISPGTVHAHKKNIRKKWKVSTNVGIAVKYILQLKEPNKI